MNQHIDDYKVSMKSKGDTALHIKREVAKITKVFDYCNFCKLSDITLDRVQRYLNSRIEEGRRARTVNSDLVAMKTFCNWAVYVERMAENPLVRLRKLKISGECRRALTHDEYMTFLAATETGGDFRCMSGKDWALLFRLAAETGYRWNELRSLVRAQFHDLESETPSVSIKGEDTKNDRDHIQPLTRDTALLLRDHLALKLPAAKAFDMPASDCGAKVVRHYLRLAGIEYVDSRGLKFDFHALRGQLASTLARSGVSPTIAHKVMRHSDINMTLKYYTHLSLEDSREAINKLPEVNIAADSQLKTGTCDAADPSLESHENFCRISAKSLPNCADSEHMLVDKTGLSEGENAAPENSQDLTEKAFTPKNKGFDSLVAPQGFEPRLNEPESSVLPLD